MIAFLALALTFIAVGAIGCYGYVSSREQEARANLAEGKRRLREAAKATEALAASRAEFEAIREETYAKAAEAQTALDQSQAQVAMAAQTLRVVQAVREQTVAIMEKRWDEPAADVAEPTTVLPVADEPVDVSAHQPVPPDEEPKTRQQLAARAKPKLRQAKVTVDVGGDVREGLVGVQ